MSKAKPVKQSDALAILAASERHPKGTWSDLTPAQRRLLAEVYTGYEAAPTKYSKRTLSVTLSKQFGRTVSRQALENLFEGLRSGTLQADS